LDGTVRIGLVGDYDAAVRAHRAIPGALQLAGDALGCSVAYEWLPTESVQEDMGRLRDFDGIWCVPASPYVSMEGALAAIRFAREGAVPFLGTCGGFQYALIEYARNVLGLSEADHAESNPGAGVLFITPLICSLRDVTGTIELDEGSRIADIYGKRSISEEYNCSFGLNPRYGALLDGSDLKITGRDADGDARVVELTGHPFFMGVLFQPERSSLNGTLHPLVQAYVQAALTHSTRRGVAPHLAASQPG
jgi:CTP synthase (UTP-ammonia lyase)